jgi:hypothetical protein
MKHAVQMASGGMIYISSCIKSGSAVQKLLWIILFHVHLLLGNGLVNKFRDDRFLVNNPLLRHSTRERKFMTRY